MISSGLLAALIMIAIIMLTGVLLNLCHCIARCMDGVPNSQGSRNLVSVVSRILDNHGLVRQSESQTSWPKVQHGQTKVIG